MSSDTSSYLNKKKVGKGKKAGETMIRAGETLYEKSGFQPNRSAMAPKLTMNRRKGER